MPRITPVHWKVLECIFKKDGFKYRSQAGSHRAYVKPGIERPIIIPAYNEIDADIIRGLIRTAKMSRDKYFRLLKKCK